MLYIPSCVNLSFGEISPFLSIEGKRGSLKTSSISWGRALDVEGIGFETQEVDGRGFEKPDIDDCGFESADVNGLGYGTPEADAACEFKAPDVDDSIFEMLNVDTSEFEAPELDGCGSEKTDAGMPDVDWCGFEAET